MKKFLIFLLSICLLSTLIPISSEAVQGTDGCIGADAQRPLLSDAAQIKNAKSAVLYEMNSDTLIYAQKPDEKVYPASMVKILTALIAIERGNLNASVQASKTAIDSIGIGAVSSKIVVGEIMSLRDLLCCMLIDSANDAAAVIAEFIGGSQDGFVALLNSYAAGLGCTNTNFTNATGLHNENQYTTARDMIRILKKATENKTFVEIFGALSYTVSATNKSEERALTTGNSLMISKDVAYYDPRVTGGRTGTAQDKTRCLAATAESGNMKLLAIVFGSVSKYAADGYTVEVAGGYPEVRTLLDLGFDTCKLTQMLFKNQVLGQREVSGGDSDLFLTVQENAFAVLPTDYVLSDVTYRFFDSQTEFAAPIAAGTVVSRVEIWYRNFCIAQAELISGSDVFVEASKVVPPAPGDEKAPFPILATLIIVVLLGTAGVLCLRIYRAKKARRSHARRRR